MIRRLDAHVSVAPQLAAGDLSDAARDGFAVLVNNRPDGEAPGQPDGDVIAGAAAAAGLAYHAIPVSPAGMGRAEVAAMAAVLDDAAGPVLAFCRSGTRSTHLWALARASRGDSPDRLIAAAAAAGYDIEGLRPTLMQLAAAA